MIWHQLPHAGPDKAGNSTAVKWVMRSPASRFKNALFADEAAKHTRASARDHYHFADTDRTSSLSYPKVAKYAGSGSI
jgi:hypothetical protein